MAKTIMLQGTGSHVGKSVLTTALCRIFFQDGYSVAPFKGQNMALNSYVTVDGGEMGGAQAIQAEACKIQPDVLMNPVLLKPTQDSASQVIVLGKPMGNLSAKDYHVQYKDKAWQVIKDSLYKLADNYQVLVIEGAGSPAEVNLKENDVVNMRVAKEIGAPVLLIADIDRGGALASVVGTLELLDQEERDLVKGIIINKFRGDINLLKPALDFLEAKTGKPVVGVMPYFQGFRIPEEDSIATENLNTVSTSQDKLDIAVIHLPYISNFTDFDALTGETDVDLRFVKKGDVLGNPDLIIIPGSKNTLQDLEYLEKSGMIQEIRDASNINKIPIIGISSGFQVLGSKIIVSEKNKDLVEYQGLGLLNTETVIDAKEITTQVKGKVIVNDGILKNCQNMQLEGYEIHTGRTTLIGEEGNSPFLLTERSDQEINFLDGAIGQSGQVFGTHLHGIFDNDVFRRQVLNNLREAKGWEPLDMPTVNTTLLKEEAYNKLAQVVRENINLPLLYKVMGLKDE